MNDKRHRAVDCESVLSDRFLLAIPAARKALVGLSACAFAGWLLCLVAVDAARGGDSLEQRREKVQNMDSSEQARLRRNLERFSDLDPEERDRLRQLHDQIEKEPNADELQAVMDRYYEWLKTLSALQRAELKDLPPDERIERIREIRQEETRREEARSQFMSGPRGEWFREVMKNQGSRALSSDDLQGLARWIEEMAPRYKTRFLDSLPEERRADARDELEKAERSGHDREVLGVLWLRWQMMHPGELPPVTNDELKSLRSKLSEDTRRWLAEQSEDQQRKILTGWIRFLVMQKFAFRRGGPRFQAASEDELAATLESLNPEERTWLLSLPADEMRRELTMRYMRSKMPDMPSFSHFDMGRSRSSSRGGFGSRRDGPPGRRDNSHGGGRYSPPNEFPPDDRPAPGGPPGESPRRQPFRPNVDSVPGSGGRFPEPPPPREPDRR